MTDAVLVQPALRRSAAQPMPLAARMQQLGVPGVSIAVLGGGGGDGRDGRDGGGDGIEWAHGFGVRDARHTDPVTTETLFQAASISKPVTALAALRLVDGGVLRLDEDVNERLRSWRVPPNGEWQPRVTMRQLLAHTGGLTVSGFPGYPPGAPRPTLRQVLDGSPPANTPPILVDTVPSLQHRYAGGGYCVLQQLLEDVTGEPFPSLVRRLVLAPCGMTRSTMEQPLPAARRAEAATGHRHGAQPIAGGAHAYPEIAAAGLWTTPSDLARFAVQLRRAAGGAPGALLSHPIAAEMLTPHVEPFVGLGVFLSGGDEDSASFFHSGGNEGFRCQMRVFRRGDAGAVVMTNGDAGGTLVADVLRTLADHYGWRGVGTALPAVSTTVDPSALALRAGDYEIVTASGVLHLALVAQADSLLLYAQDQPALALYPQSDTAFFALDANVRVTFPKDTAGSVSGFTLRQNDRDLTAVRRA